MDEEYMGHLPLIYIIQILINYTIGKMCLLTKGH